MIPYILIIIGMLLSVVGIVCLLRVAILPLRRLNKVVFEWEDDILKYSSGPGKREYARRLKQLTWIYVCVLLLGICSFFLGLYLGYAAKGSSFWFYEQIFGQEIQEEYWDKITEDNKFISDLGKEYTYYILVENDSFSFCGENCKDIDDLKNKLSKIKRENTVILIDSFAVSSAYHEAENILNELGVKFEMEEE